MKKKSQLTFKLIAVPVILVMSLLASCANITFPTTVCHANGNTTNPYDALSVNNANELLAHRAHNYDVFPMPVGGCPATLVENNNGKITICHATGSDKNPYNEITISVYGLNGHAKHEGDIIPMPDGGCPTVSGMEKDNKGQSKK